MTLKYLQISILLCLYTTYQLPDFQQRKYQENHHYLYRQWQHQLHYKFDYNKDAAMFICPAGHMAVRKAMQGKKNIGVNQVCVYYFDIEKCKI